MAYISAMTRPMHPQGISRRNLARLFTWSGVGLTFAGCSEAGAEPGKRVLILGAGLAGLAAAYELQMLGYEVSLLEVRDRVGGRVWTKRDGFEDGHYAEIGAVRIPDVHDRTIDYCERLGLELDEIPSGEALYYLDGKSFMHTEGQPWPVDGLTPTEAEMGLGLWGTYIAGAFDEFGDPAAATFPAAAAVEAYDDVVYTDFLRGRGASEAWLKLYASDNGAEIQTIGTLAWMAAESVDRAWDKTFHIRGGNDQLPQRLAEEVGMDKISLGSQVTKIEHRADGVVVTYTKGGEELTAEADYLVCAIPFSTLRDVTIEPAFSEEKTRAIAELFMMNAGRGYVQTKTRFWEKMGIGGLKIAKTDTKVERLWNLSDVMPAGSAKGMIVSYTQDANADAYCKIDPAGREAYTLDEIEKFFPEIKAEKVVFFHFCWAEDPWAKGAWTDILPGQWWIVEATRRVEGRVFFAGEHTSVWAGWMQGAIESGQRVADEIVGTG